MSLLIISSPRKCGVLPVPTVQREIAFMIMEVARLLKTYADQRARQYGMTRAQWAVLFRLDRSEGLKQSELAELLDLQPITLTRLLDRLSDNGLIERRADPNDRRANRLFLTPAARPLLERLTVLGEDMMGDGARRPRCQDERAHAAQSWAGQRKPARRDQSQSDTTRGRRRLIVMSEKPLKIVPAPEAKAAPAARPAGSCAGACGRRARTGGTSRTPGCPPPAASACA